MEEEVTYMSEVIQFPEVLTGPARRAYLRIVVLSQKGVSPHSEEGRGAKRWGKDHQMLYEALGWKPKNLAEQLALEKWAYTQLGYAYEVIGNTYAWRKEDSPARRRWRLTLERSREQLPDWCQGTAEIERHAIKQLTA